MIITRPLLKEIHAHLEAGYPHEACGVMLGRDGRVTEIVRADNQRTDSAHNRYLIDARDYLKIEREADRRQLQVVGIYHSHPDEAARPSGFDLEWAWPNLAYLIVSIVQGRAAEEHCWRVRDDQSVFDPETLTIEG